MALYATVITIVSVLLLSLLYWFFHKNKSTVFAILIFGISLTFIITYIIQSDMGIGVGLGLFGIMSLIRFRESFDNDLDIIYLFVGISFAILSAIIVNVNLLVLVYVLLYVIIVGVEVLLCDVLKMTVDVDINHDFSIEDIENTHNISIQKVQLKVIDTYKLRKTYVVYYINNNDG